jgi:hypothetical protein
VARDISPRGDHHMKKFGKAVEKLLSTDTAWWGWK